MLLVIYVAGYFMLQYAPDYTDLWQNVVDMNVWQPWLR